MRVGLVCPSTLSNEGVNQHKSPSALSPNKQIQFKRGLRRTKGDRYADKARRYRSYAVLHLFFWLNDATDLRQNVLPSPSHPSTIDRRTRRRVRRLSRTAIHTSLRSIHPVKRGIHGRAVNKSPRLACQPGGGSSAAIYGRTGLEL